MNRREWLIMTGAAAAFAAERKLKFRAYGPDGQAASADRLATLMLVKPNGQPYHIQPKVEPDGTVVMDAPNGPFQVTMNLPVRGFGRVYLMADNGGKLYRGGGEYTLNAEFARSRAALVRRYVTAAQKEGVTFSAAALERLTRGEAALKRADGANESLAETLWAGEMAAVERARHRIAKNGPRPGFLFGCNAFRYARSEEYARQWREVFNFATLPFYRTSTERVEGKVNYREAEATLEKMAGTGVLFKGHPLVWFHNAGYPVWMKGRAWPEIFKSCREYVLQSVSRFRSRIHSWDTINEAHDWANELGFSQQQLMDLTRMASDATREADPTAFRVINSCETWAEYIPKRRSYFGPLTEPVRTPLEYYEAVRDAGVEYEAIGLQMYNPERDMLEVERQLERFFAFGKPIHITELGVPSTSAHRRSPEREKLWRGEEWTPGLQADWVEQFYTICYSKPLIQAVTWWDFSDPAFTTDGGLLDEKQQPKEAYHRLKKLVEGWRTA